MATGCGWTLLLSWLVLPLGTAQVDTSQRLWVRGIVLSSGSLTDPSCASGWLHDLGLSLWSLLLSMPMEAASTLGLLCRGLSLQALST